MYINNFLVKNFEEQENKEFYSIDIPIGSKFLTCKAVPDGIRAWYEVPSLDVDFTQDRFIILKDKQTIPSGATFVTIIDIIVGEEDDQKVIILPIYKL